ncbi:hypothetical protein KFU94_30855 [Chloroflexi bacterium TSY]|nr:hypothetical protein [Chloroflexi bacterium TSY]
MLGNFIGTDVKGTKALGNGGDGVFIAFGASENVIGGETAGARNLISGNSDNGVFLQEMATTNNQVLGNFIGVDVTGIQPLGNGGIGVVLSSGANKNVIGGGNPGARNIVSANGQDGIQLQNPDTSNNRIEGNFIGTDVAGARSLGNGQFGISIGFEASNNVIGGETAGARNLISGNRGVGVQIQDTDTTDNQVLGNFIGTNITGTGVISNTDIGIIISEASNNMIGGESESTRNLISGNGEHGIQIQLTGATGNQIQGNYIGTDVTGTQSLGNQINGILIGFGASDNVIGGESMEARNVVSGNGGDGIHLQERNTTGNRILGNYIGTDVQGRTALGNYAVGVRIGLGASNNIVGGLTSSARNLVSGNHSVGVQIEDSGTTDNMIWGNYIGTDADGMSVLSNLVAGVAITTGASRNVIGGETLGAGNLISGNSQAGIWLQDPDTSENCVMGNYIGTDKTGLQALGNRGVGVGIALGAGNNEIGGGSAGARNLISGNELAGVLLKDNDTRDNRVLGNYIGIEITGSKSLPNLLDGIAISNGASANVIGENTEDGRNVISGNDRTGIWLEGNNTTTNKVSGNFIGVDASGSNRLGNGEHGISINNGVISNTIGVSNTIVDNGLAGIVIKSETSLGNTITRNLIRHNGGLPIDWLVPTSLISPTLTSYSPSNDAISGQACSGCCVEIFATAEAMPGSMIYLGNVAANAGGVFTLLLDNPPPSPYLFATITDADGTTSEFSTGLDIAQFPTSPQPLGPNAHQLYLSVIFGPSTMVISARSHCQ